MTLEEVQIDYARWCALSKRLVAAKYRRRQLDLPMFVRIRDEPREERNATEEEGRSWQEEADAEVADARTELAALENARLEDEMELRSHLARAEHLLGLGVALPEKRPACAPEGYGFEVLATLKALGLPVHQTDVPLSTLCASVVDHAQKKQQRLSSTRIPCDVCDGEWCGGCTVVKGSKKRGRSMSVAEFMDRK